MVSKFEKEMAKDHDNYACINRGDALHESEESHE